MRAGQVAGRALRVDGAGRLSVEAVWDHVILKEYVTYYSRTRTYLWLDKDAPFPRPVAPLTAGRVIAIPQVGGLHHRYERAA